MSDSPLWTPTAEPEPHVRAIRRAIRAMLPALLTAAEAGTPGPGRHLQDLAPPFTGRVELRLQGIRMLRHGPRDAVALSLLGHAGTGAALWAVGATAVLDRATRAILALELRLEARQLGV
jgi:hypothetical protein